MNKNKGFTTIELIVSFTLVSVIVYFLFEMIFAMKNIYVDSGIKTKLLFKQAEINKMVNDDFINKRLNLVDSCGDTCARFSFNDGTVKELSYDRDEKWIMYGSTKTYLAENSNFGNIDISAENYVNNEEISNNSYDSILTISLPIYNNIIENTNFGLNVIYQYKKEEVAITDFSIKDMVDKEGKIVLVGSTNDYKLIDNTYNDPGFYVLDNNGSRVDSPNIKVIGSIGNEVGKTYTLTYQLIGTGGSVLAETKRNVTIIKKSYLYEMTRKEQKFYVPVSGTYKVELWGASGGQSIISGSKLNLGGKGAYVEANISLVKDSLVFVNVGEEGQNLYRNKDLGNVSISSFNGGMTGCIKSLCVSSSNLSSSGGGASDIRIGGNALTNRKLVAAGGGGGGSSSDANGGDAGSNAGFDGTGSSTIYIGRGGSLTAGGATATYVTNQNSDPKMTPGELGKGGMGYTYNLSNSCTTNIIGAGGGGGYYGGGGSAPNGGGGGGSSYCDASLSCRKYSGKESFYNPSGISEVGHTGDGYVKITLISIEI